MDFIFNNGENELTFKNPENKTEIVFIFREPSVDEKLKYNSAIAFLFRDKEIDEDHFQELSKIKIRFALEIMTGFKVKDIPINISSDPQSETYAENWKDLIAQRAPELVMMLAQSAYESGGFVPEKNF